MPEDDAAEDTGDDSVGHLQSSSGSVDTSMTLQLLRNINVELSINFLGDSHTINTYDVTGPSERFNLLDDINVKQSDLSGMMSPLGVVNVPTELRSDVGVPVNAVHYAFAYPVGKLADKLEHFQVGQEDEWLWLLKIGGFVYFDEANSVIGVNALGLVLTTTTLYLHGPHAATVAASTLMTSQERMLPITLGPMHANGFRAFGWVHADETFDGQPLGLTREYPHGAFVYQLADGAWIFFVLQPSSCSNPEDMVGAQKRVPSRLPLGRSQIKGGVGSMNLLPGALPGSLQAVGKLGEPVAHVGGFFASLRTTIAQDQAEEESELREMSNLIGHDNAGSSILGDIVGDTEAGRLAAQVGGVVGDTQAVRIAAQVTSQVSHIVSDKVEQKIVKNIVPKKFRPRRKKDSKKTKLLTHLEEICMPGIVSIAMCVPVGLLVSLAYVNRFIFFICAAFGWYGLYAYTVLSLVADTCLVGSRLTLRQRHHFGYGVLGLTLAATAIDVMHVETKTSAASMHYLSTAAYVTQFAFGFGVPLTLWWLNRRAASELRRQEALAFRKKEAASKRYFTEVGWGLRHKASVAPEEPQPAAKEATGRLPVDLSSVKQGTQKAIAKVQDLADAGFSRRRAPVAPGNDQQAAKEAASRQPVDDIDPSSVTHETLKAIAKVQARFRSKQARRLFEQRAAGRMALEKPILLVAAIHFFGTRALEHAHGAFELDSGPEFSFAFMMRTSWIWLLVPCLLILLRDFRRTPRPQFSMGHVAFIVVVLYRSTRHLAAFDVFIFDKLETFMLQGGSSAGYWLALIENTIPSGYLVHLILSSSLLVTTKLSVRLVAAANTRPHFLYPLQFFEYCFVLVFYSLRTLQTGVTLTFVVSQVAVHLFLFLRDTQLIKCVAPAIVKPIQARCERLLKLNRNRNLKEVDTDNDPLFTLQYAAALAMQYEFASTCAVITSVLLIAFFMWRDGFFTLQNSSLLVRTCDVPLVLARYGIILGCKMITNACTRCYLARVMRKTLLGKRTVHGESPLASEILASRALNKNLSVSEVGDQRMELHLSTKIKNQAQMAAVKKELSLKNLDYHAFYRRTVRRQLRFYMCTMLLQLYACFPVTGFATRDYEDSFRMTALNASQADAWLSRFRAETSASFAESTVKTWEHFVWTYVPPLQRIELDANLRKRVLLSAADNSINITGTDEGAQNTTTVFDQCWAWPRLQYGWAHPAGGQPPV